MGVVAREASAEGRQSRANRAGRRAIGTIVVAALVVAAFVAAAAGCATVRPTSTGTVARPSTSAPLLQPGRPGEETHAIDLRAAIDLTRVGVTQADVRFMRGMIGHHAQAVEMVELLKTRTRRDDVKLLGARIEVSQRDEIAMMRGWLEARGQGVPAAHSHHPDHAAGGGSDETVETAETAETLMPGMLTAAQMSALASATETAFDRLFLFGMIQHHEGALTMVQELFAAPGAAQDSEMFAFASDVDADQRMEIVRMRVLLNELEKESR